MKKKSVLIVLLVMGAMLSACNFPLAFDDPEDVENAVAETLAAIEAEEEVVVPTLVLAPTSTPMPTEDPEADKEEETDTAEPEVKPTEKPICFSATAYDLTVPDDTVITAGTKFNKAWTFKNVGYCDWTSNYKLVFDSGRQLGGPDSKEIGVKVAPNGTVDVNLVLYAPAKAGTYRGYWMLQTDKGVDIGPVWVQIVVK